MAEPFDSALAELHKRLPRAHALAILLGDEVRAARGLDAPLPGSLLEKVRLSGEPELLGGVLCVPLRDAQGKTQGLIYAEGSRPLDRTDLFRVVQLGRELEKKLGLRGSARWTPGQLSLPTATGAPKSLPGRSRVIFLRSLATMLGAGIPLARALAMLAEQREGNRLSQVSMAVLQEIEQGNPLSQGLERCRGCFTPFQIQLVRVGEKSGSLLAVLEELARHEEQSRALTLKVRAALTYPLAMFAVCCLLLMVVPPLMVQGPLRALTELGTQTPLLTRVVMNVTAFMVSPLGMLTILGSLAFLGLGLWQTQQRPKGRLWLHRQLLAAGPVGNGLKMLALARFSRALAVMTRTGVQLLHALPLALSTTADPVLREATPAAVRALQEGAELSEVLAMGGYFPPGYVMVLRAAEETGRLERTLTFVAGVYELELESALEIACAALEPLLMLVMGIVAGVVALAVLMPLVKLVQAL